jgi:hypothetical protein
MKITQKLYLLAVAAFATLCLTGCFSLECSKPENSKEEHLVVRNYGWKLFYFLPIVCGNTDENAAIPWTFFKDDVTMDTIQSRFMSYAHQRGKTATSLTYNNYDTVLWSIPLANIPIPIPYLLCYNEIQISGRIK